MAFALPFDLQYFLVTTFAGNFTIFLAIALLMIAGLTAYFRMPNSLTLVSFALFLTLLATYFRALFVLSIIIGGFVMYWLLSKLYKT